VPAEAESFPADRRAYATVLWLSACHL